VPDRDAERIKDRVEQLDATLRSGNEPSGKLLAWLHEIGNDLYDRLVRVGLARPRASASPTLAEFLERYRDDRPDVGDGTKATYRTVSKRLLAFFGTDRRLADVSAGDADRFADHLRAEYAQATAAKTIKMARQFFRRAVRLGLIPSNPFAEVQAGTEQNRARSFFVTAPAARKLLEACPDHEWRLIVALARYGGLRTPSETLALTWPDVLWDQDRFRVRSPKTERQGKPERIVPLFPELRAVLGEAFEAAPEGAVFVISRYRDTGTNLRTQLMRIIRRAGLVPWPRLFQNLRASRETELAERFPLRVVTDWLGNTPSVAHDHYLSTTEEHFRRAVLPAGAEGGAQSGAPAAQNPAQHGAAPTRTDSQDSPEVLAACDLVREGASPDNVLPFESVTPWGSELPRVAVDGLASIHPGPAGAADVDDLAALERFRRPARHDLG
jgi:integrase